MKTDFLWPYYHYTCTILESKKGLGQSKIVYKNSQTVLTTVCVCVCV